MMRLGPKHNRITRQFHKAVQEGFLDKYSTIRLISEGKMKKSTVCALVTIAALALVSVFILSGHSLAASVADQPVNLPAQETGELLTTSAITLDPVPHPILSDINVRRAIAYCTNKDALVAAAYPELTESEQLELISVTYLHPSNWAYTEPQMTYAYNPSTGADLLDAAGWLLPPGGDFRLKEGKELVLTVKSTTNELRLEYLPVFESQMNACGIRVIRMHKDNLDWLFVRDFEAGNYAWAWGEEPGGEDLLYACDSVPSQDNGWAGQNYTGWCNEEATEAIIQANDTTLSQEERQALYATFIDLFAEDMPVLPLFFWYGTTDYWYWEHIDLNLETYAQTYDLTPAGTGDTGLSYYDHLGNELNVIAPAGAVTQTVTLSYDPLLADTELLPGEMIETNAFRLTALLAGVPQDDFAFTEPLTLTVAYNPDQIVYRLLEHTLVLYALDEETGEWVDASESCPEGERYKQLDMDANLFTVRVCHLSEFSLNGEGGNVRMGVNYGLDEAAGMYEVGHTFSITVTDSIGTLKATATVDTEPATEGDCTGTGPDFACSDGFWVQQDDWSDPNLDILPGDLVYFQSDEDFSETIEVGTVTARLNPLTDSASGTITAPGFTEHLEAFAGYWGWFWEQFIIDPAGGYFFVYFESHDLEPGNQVSIGYDEPDRDAVRNVFYTPEYGEYYLPIVLKPAVP
jgi:peptide/nickel transport system substrate-binding protein